MTCKEYNKGNTANANKLYWEDGECVAECDDGYVFSITKS